MCDHLHDSASRDDAAERVLALLLVCCICGSERIVETLEYEPRPVRTSPGPAPRTLLMGSSIPRDVTLADWRYRTLAA
jgi:hypothetical protein